MHKQICRIQKMAPILRNTHVTYIPCQWPGEMTDFSGFLASFPFLRNAFYFWRSNSLHKSCTYECLLIANEIFHDNPGKPPPSFSWGHNISFLYHPESIKLPYCWQWTFNHKDKLEGLNWSLLFESTLLFSKNIHNSLN